MKRKITSVILTLFMLVSFASPFAGYAAAAPVITVSSVSDTAGAVVNVAVTIENNPGILGASLEFTFDAGLTLENATCGDAFSMLTMTKPGKLTSPCKFIWDGQELNEDDVADGTVVVLQFSIPENAAAGTEYAIRASCDAGDFVDVDLNPISVNIVSGSITVVDYMPGDLNSDKKVNTTDVIMLRRHIAGGYTQTVNDAAADVNGDALQNATDVILVRRYIAGGYGVELKPSAPQCAHTMEEIAYKAPECTEDGNLAYWHCTICNKYYNDENGTTAINPDNSKLDATGHTVVIDAAVEPTYESSGWTEGKHCSVCNDVIVEQKEIPALQKDEYSIIYHIYNNDDYLKSIHVENPNPAVYSKQDGLVLQNLLVDGYNFIGWFTAQTGGTQVTEFAAGTTGNKTLYAQWEKVQYTVQFASDMIPVGDLTYTAGEERTLPKPVLDRYTFVGWSDKDGKMWDTIPVGTAKNLVLYANWASNRNKAVAVNQLSDPIICEDSEAGLMLFTYEIGEIQNVPLYTILKLNCVNGIISSVSTTTSQEISSTQAATIAQTISNATTSSASWTLENNWNSTTEVSQSYLDQSGQTREEAESLAKNESGTYNLTASSGGSGGSTETSTGSFKLSGNNAHSDTSTTETGQNFGLSVDGKFSSETSIGAEIPLKMVNLDVGTKYGFEIGAGADYGNYVKNTNTGTDSWTIGADISSERSKTTTDEKNWNTSKGYSNSKSTSTNSSVANAVSKLISEQYGYGSSYAEGGSNSSSQALASTDTKSDEYSTTMTYHTAKIESTTKSIETTGNTIGDYRYVMAGTVHVFAVVGYDVAEKTYFVYTYNVMDDETFEYVDYSFDGTFNDYETSIIPFEIPHFVNDYVNTRVAKTAGLQIDPDTGMIMNYIPDPENPDTIVIIPSYISIDNGDGTFRSVKVTGIAPGLFKNNTNIKGVKLGNYITEIPDSAFEGCTALQYVITPGVTKIGNNAFKGCTALGEFTVSEDVATLGANAFEGALQVKAAASSKAVAQAIAASGAENIVLDISSVPEASGMSFEVGAITSFELQGKDKEYSGLSVKSDAATTIINGVKFTDCTNIPMEIASENITLNRVTASTGGFALVMTADTANVKLNQTITLSAIQGNAVLCKNVNFSSLSNSVVGKMTLSGDMLTAGTVSGQNHLTFTSGEIKTITADEFESYRSSCNLLFDANGGTSTVSAKQVAFNSPFGELPTPTYSPYTFLGWYTAKTGGTKVTADTVMTSLTDTIVYARWNNWDGTSTEPAYDANTKTYTITTGSELAWVSDVMDGSITAGTNFPTDITFNGYSLELSNDVYLNDVSDAENWDEDTWLENNWKPIGAYGRDNIADISFAGAFNGNNNTIYGLYSGYNSDGARGLFGNSSGTIKNLNICHAYLDDSNKDGAMVAYNTGTIKHCNSVGKIFDGSGFVGENNGTIDECVNYANIYNGNGIAVENNSSIKNSTNKGSVQFGNGFVEDNNGSIMYCVNEGNIYSIGSAGIAEFNDGDIRYCVNKGTIESTSDVGGIASYNSGTGKICYSYNHGTVQTTSSGAGGISGSNSGDIWNCYNRGRIYAGRYEAGGISGSTSEDITECYNTGSVSSGNGYAGAIVGDITDEDAILYHCYATSATLYNISSSIIPSISMVYQKTSSQMKSLSNLPGFYDTTWAVDSGINDGYPYLKTLKDTYQ